jgi:hypothetical protein
MQIHRMVLAIELQPKSQPLLPLVCDALSASSYQAMSGPELPLTAALMEWLYSTRKWSSTLPLNSVDFSNSLHTPLR